MMTGVVHRYVRRLIVWAQTPSAEEITHARRKRLTRNVRNALLTEKHYNEWQGLPRTPE